MIVLVYFFPQGSLRSKAIKNYFIQDMFHRVCSQNKLFILFLHKTDIADVNEKPKRDDKFFVLAGLKPAFGP